MSPTNVSGKSSSPQTIFERRVLAGAQSTRLLCPDDRVLIAVSGGPDSVALLSLCVAWKSLLNLTLWVIHVNHGLRGEEGCEDAAFVEALCHRLGVVYRQRNLALNGVADSHGRKSLHAVARDQRYRVFLEESRTVKANKIALGHTKDDQAETVVMWMLRGAGSAGLSGMPAYREPGLIRPLLQSTKQDLLKYLAEKGLDYRTDSSNRKRVYLRNRLRLDVMPVLQTVNPNLPNVLSRQAEILREEDRFLDQLAMTALSTLIRQEGETLLRLDRQGFLENPLALQRRMCLMAVKRVGRLSYRPTFEWVEFALRGMAHGRSGVTIQLGPVSVTREYEVIDIRRAEQVPSGHSTQASPEGLPFPIPSRVKWPPTGQVIEGCLAQKGESPVAGSPHVAWFDTSTFSMPLVIRAWNPGDWFCPLGLHGKRKKVKNFFSDKKVSRSYRHRVPLIEAPEGILWIGGYRADHRFYAQPSSDNVVKIHLSTKDMEE